MFEVDHTEREQRQEWKNSGKMGGWVDEQKDGWMGGRMGGWVFNLLLISLQSKRWTRH